MSDGLAGAVVADQRRHLPCREVEVHVGEGLNGAEALVEPRTCKRGSPESRSGASTSAWAITPLFSWRHSTAPSDPTIGPPPRCGGGPAGHVGIAPITA